MDDTATAFTQSRLQTGEDDILHCEVPDAALEAAAMVSVPSGAMSFPNAPTVSILVVCCSFDGS